VPSHAHEPARPSLGGDDAMHRNVENGWRRATRRLGELYEKRGHRAKARYYYSHFVESSAWFDSGCGNSLERTQSGRRDLPRLQPIVHWISSTRISCPGLRERFPFSRPAGSL
jgi:hypothetical protein